jgi:O-antigen/teichoic acid export membrane protein
VGEPDVLASREAGPAALRGGAMRTVGYVVGILVTLASAPILIRHLGVADFGRYTTVVALLAVVGGITEGGLNAIAQREYVTLEGERRTVVMRQLLGIRVLLTAAGVALATVFGLVAGYDDVLVLGTLAGGLGLLLAGLQGLLTSVLQARLRFGWATVIDLIRQVATAALIIGLAVAGASLLPFFAVPIAAGVVALVLTVWLVRGFVPLRPAFRLGEWLPLVRDTLPYAIATALNAAYFRVAIILMSLQATALQTGYYATAFRVVEVLIMVPVLGVGAAFPILTKAAKDDASRFDHAATRILELALIAGVWMALVLGLGAQVAIDVLADDAQPAVAVLRLQGLALIPAFLALGAVFPLLSLHRYRAIMVANGVALVAAVVLTLALVPGLEARGAALATTLAELTSATIVIAVLIRAKPALASVVRSVPAVALAAAAGAAAALLPGVPATADVAIGSAAFLAVLAATGRFPPEVSHALRRRVVRPG